MAETPQTDSQNVLQHGNAVWEKTKLLVSGQWDGMRIPSWLKERHVDIVNAMYSPEIVKAYNVFHDCGKPFCLEYDYQGRRHFPDHANISAETYRTYFEDPGGTVSSLIRDDMDLHTLTADEIKAKEWSKPHAMTLLMTALAEIHANAEMFGGIESSSFKSKWKKLDRRGKMLVKLYLPEQYKKHSYLIVRKDLPTAQQTIQASHAAIEMARNMRIDHPSLVAVVVRNEKKLKSVISEMMDQGIKTHIFRDNLFDDSITAVCTEPLNADKREALKRFQLLR